MGTAALAVLTLALAPLAAQSTPPPPAIGGLPVTGNGPAAASGGSSDLVETTFADPDWVLATSDHILRATTCVFTANSCSNCTTCWYDRIESTPCYQDTRVFKFAPDRKTGKRFAGAAFTMASLGVGTFDGLYVKPGVTFQLYRGSTTANPLGGPRTGPMYASPASWRSHPCRPAFEPGTVFVPGPNGGLNDYSIDLGRVEIDTVDLLAKTNRTAHHTTAYANRLVLRRGQSFDVELTLSREFSPGVYDLELTAVHRFDGPAIDVPIPLTTGTLDPDRWNFVVTAITGKDDADRVVELEVNLPPDAPIGSFDFRIETKKKLVGEIEAEETVSDAFVILANPWSDKDAVHVATAADRDEYVTSQTGRIWHGHATKPETALWGFDMFDPGGNTLDVTLAQLKGLDAADRADAALVARRLAARANSDDASGILTGDWSGNHGTSLAPEIWGSSHQIIRRYQTNQAAIEYGRSIAFAGLLTSMTRVLGLPSRPVTAYASARDTDGTDAVERRFKADGSFDRTATKDSVQTTHAFCEVWIDDDWHALDGTPQIASGGEFRIGPAPVAKVLAKSGGDYDVDFLATAVDGDIEYLLDDAPNPPKTIRTDAERVGAKILTKAVGSQMAADITANYKAAPRRPGATGPTKLPSGIEVELVAPADALVTDALDWKLVIENTATSALTVDVTMTGSALDVRGAPLGALGVEVARSIPLLASEKATVPLTIPQATVDGFLNRTRHFGVDAFLAVQGTTDTFADHLTTELQTAAVTIQPTPTGTIEVSKTIKLAVDFDNPLTSALTNVRVHFALGTGLRFETGTSPIVDLATIAVGRVAGSAPIRAEVDALAVHAGECVVRVLIESDELSGMAGDLLVTTTPCPMFTAYGAMRNTGKLSGRGSTALGEKATFELEQPQSATASGLLAISAIRDDLTVPGIGVLLIDTSTFALLPMDPFANGSAQLELTIPTDRSSIGRDLHLQGVALDTAASEPVRLSNGLTIRICP